MNDLRISTVSFPGEILTVTFSDGQQASVPLAYFPRLQSALVAQRDEWQLIGRGLGVHWESVDEDLSVENILTAYSRHRKASYAASAA